MKLVFYFRSVCTRSLWKCRKKAGIQPHIGTLMYHWHILLNVKLTINQSNEGGANIYTLFKKMFTEKGHGRYAWRNTEHCHSARKIHKEVVIYSGKDTRSGSILTQLWEMRNANVDFVQFIQKEKGVLSSSSLIFYFLMLSPHLSDRESRIGWPVRRP